jgi:kumamolisin
VVGEFAIETFFLLTTVATTVNSRTSESKEISMKRFACLGGVALLAFFMQLTNAAGQEIRDGGPTGYVYVPASSIERPQDRGIKMHTNIQIFVPYGKEDNSVPPPSAETPASLACIYQLVPQVSGCPISGSTNLPGGGFGAIALVDAFDNPNAEQDLITFSTQFGLPQCTKANGCFQQIYADGTQPPNDPGGWSLEEALDIEMAHAMAPNAKIILVEAKDNFNTSLYHAEDVASRTVHSLGGGTISNSWSGSEYRSEVADDGHFRVLGIVYFASTGDSGAPVGYPAASPFVVAAGGTQILRDAGNFSGENGWNGSGGGPSLYETRPLYQNVIKNIVGNRRGTPDFSADAAPGSGVAMYDADGGTNWIKIGGTSVSSPMLAGMVNAANSHAISTEQELSGLYTYASRHYPQAWRDEITGNNGFSCTVGWDFVTGIGSPLTYAGK